VREHGRPALLLDDRGGEPLDRFVGKPMETGSFLLTRGEAAKNTVSVQTQLTEGLPLIDGDRWNYNK
jgi:hypothetical protein